MSGLGHQGGDDFIVIFSDETGEDRPAETMRAFVDDVRAAAQRAGFDISSWGADEAVRSMIVKSWVRRTVDEWLR